MGKEENLVQVRSEKEAREKGAKGGLASGEARRKKRAMRERLRALLDGKHEGMDGADALAAALFDKAMGGDVRAFETIMAMAGEARQVLELPGLPDIRKASDLPKLTGAIIEAVAAGELTPDEGQKLASLAGLHLKALEMGELEQRIAALEAGAAKEKKV